MVSTSLDELPLAWSANRALAQFWQLAEITGNPVSGAELLYERAYLRRNPPDINTALGSSCHLLPCLDAVLAINLPRPSDWEMVPAWLGPWHDNLIIPAGDWPALAHHCHSLPAADLLEQAHCLGLAVAVASELPPPAPAPAIHKQSFPKRRSQHSPQQNAQPLVVDLSSLWAGPLCSHLLQQAGCRVIKVEGVNRHDGARDGNPHFYQLLNQGKEAVMLDFRSVADIERLQQLLARADIVIEGSRPRALRNLGIDAEQWIQSAPGKIWLSITGYGRQGIQGERIGFGDDTAAAAGLSRIMYDATGDYQIVGDAIADPLTGIHGALFVWQSHLAGGNELLAISLRDTVSTCLHHELELDRDKVLDACRLWHRENKALAHFFPAGARHPTAPCAAPGQDNESIFNEIFMVG